MAGRQVRDTLRGQTVHPARGRFNLSWQVSGLAAEAAFHSCGGSAGPEPQARTGFPIITRPCDPGDHDTQYVVCLFEIPVNGYATQFDGADIKISLYPD